MPVMGGVEAVRRLKADPLPSAIPVAVLSGDAVRDRSAVAEAGCLTCLVKPCVLVDLERVVDALLPPDAATSCRDSQTG
jgi:CheY-like chemotaxis protein